MYKYLNCFTRYSEWKHLAADERNLRRGKKNHTNINKDREREKEDEEKNSFCLGQSPYADFSIGATAFLKKSARHFVCTLEGAIVCCHSN